MFRFKLINLFKTLVYRSTQQEKLSLNDNSLSQMIFSDKNVFVPKIPSLKFFVTTNSACH